MKIKKAIIISLSSYKLSSQEIKIFKKYNPWGVILFRRNIKNYNQVKKLTSEIKKVTNDKNYPILIDEEGGKVSRLKGLKISVIGNSLIISNEINIITNKSEFLK